MKILGQLLVWISLAGGVLSAATAYLSSLDAADEELVGSTRLITVEKEELAERGHQLDTEYVPVTAELLAELDTGEVRDIRVKEFSFKRWRGKWYFLLSLVGLLAGGLLTRFRARPPQAAETDAAAADTPRHTLEALHGEIDRLRRELPEMPGQSARLDAIVGRIGQLQKTHMQSLVDARETLISMLGLAGYAALMSSYATAERQINAAWSAAADGVYEEAAACLDGASTLIAETRRELHST